MLKPAETGELDVNATKSMTIKVFLILMAFAVITAKPVNAVTILKYNDVNYGIIDSSSNLSSFFDGALTATISQTSAFLILQNGEFQYGYDIDWTLSGSALSAPITRSLLTVFNLRTGSFRGSDRDGNVVFNAGNSGLPFIQNRDEIGGVAQTLSTVYTAFSNIIFQVDGDNTIFTFAADLGPAECVTNNCGPSVGAQIPLPAAGWMLLSALAGLGFVKFRLSRV